MPVPVRAPVPLRILLVVVLLVAGCGGGGGGGGVVLPPLRIAFDAIGADLGASDLTAFAFLPGTGGDALVVTKGGTVIYTQGHFTGVVASTTLAVASAGEQGIGNLVADPDYPTNGFVFLYHTLPDGSANRLLRVTVNVSFGTPSLSLDDPVTIADFPLSESPSPGTNHCGGGLVIDGAGRILLGVGDGGGTASANTTLALSQDLDLRLGKLHRLIPSRAVGVGGFTVPANGVSTTHPSIFASGLRNPFTMALAPDGAVLIGDVGAGFAEEIDRADVPGLNFGWPLAEGPVATPPYTDPVHGYLHADSTFEDQDPSPAPGGGPQAIMVGTHYAAGQYGGQLDGMLLYAEFYEGWVRGLRLDTSGVRVSDQHLGHLEGMTCLRTGADGLLYANSAFRSSRIYRVRLE